MQVDFLSRKETVAYFGHFVPWCPGIEGSWHLNWQTGGVMSNTNLSVLGVFLLQRPQRWTLSHGPHLAPQAPGTLGKRLPPLFRLNMHTHLPFSTQMNYASGWAGDRDRWLPTKGHAGCTQSHHIKMFPKGPACPRPPRHRAPLLCGCLHHCLQRPSQLSCGYKSV